MMHTPQYRSDHAGLLLGNWPRIPLPATAELLTHSAALGRRLADLLDPESDIQLQAEWSFLGRLSIPPESTGETPEENDRRNTARFALTVGWGGAGQGATVMPRRGKSPQRDWTAHELERLTALAATQSLTLDQALAFLGPCCVDVYLNDTALWSAVPVNVWEYTLGGYQVLKKWLSYREQPLLGRPLREDEARYFAQVVRRITAILLLSPALDASYGSILPGATGLPA
jgi:Predicted helicase